MQSTLTKREILEALQGHRSDLHRLGVTTIALFGSHATGAQTSSSDLDFVVEFSEPTYDNFAGLEEFLEELFARPVAIVTPAGIDSIRVPSVAEDIRRSLVHV